MDALDVIIGSSWCTCLALWTLWKWLVFGRSSTKKRGSVNEKPKQRRIHIDDSLKKSGNFTWVAA
jgi:hypothetical protein